MLLPFTDAVRARGRYRRRAHRRGAAGDDAGTSAATLPNRSDRIDQHVARHRPHPLPRHVSGAARRRASPARRWPPGCGRSTPSTSARTPPTGTARVDDTPAGGGPGMVMRADVLARAIDAVGARGRSAPAPADEPARRPLTQARVAALAAGPGAVILCGRFEGVDERVIEARGARGGLDRRLRAVGRRDRGAGAARCLRAAAARRHGQGGLGRGGELRRKACSNTRNTPGRSCARAGRSRRC